MEELDRSVSERNLTFCKSANNVAAIPTGTAPGNVLGIKNTKNMGFKDWIAEMEGKVSKVHNST